MKEEGPLILAPDSKGYSPPQWGGAGIRAPFAVMAACCLTCSSHLSSSDSSELSKKQDQAILLKSSLPGKPLLPQTLPTKTVPLAGDQLFKHVSLWGTFYGQVTTQDLSGLDSALTLSRLLISMVSVSHLLDVHPALLSGRASPLLTEVIPWLSNPPGTALSL